MLTEQEKKELLEDAENKQRQKEFRLLRKLQEEKALSPMQFISFLDQLTAIFSRVIKTPEIIKSKNFRL